MHTGVCLTLLFIVKCFMTYAFYSRKGIQRDYESINKTCLMIARHFPRQHYNVLLCTDACTALYCEFSNEEAVVESGGGGMDAPVASARWQVGEKVMGG